MKLKVIRKICMLLLPILLATSLITNYCFPSLTWAAAFYTISLTANIGYFTNYIAIKMLFKPHYKTAFGRQGLIPKNQNKLADSLSQTLIDNFLSKSQWQEYLENSNLVNKVLDEAKTGSLNWLSNPQNIEAVVRYANDYLQQNKTAINNYFNQVQKELVNELTERLDAQQLLSHGFDWLDDQFEKNPQQMHSMIEPIIKTIAENIPEIAHRLSIALDAHIEEQDTIKRGIAKMAKWSADFDSDDIKRYLFRLVASFEFRETLFDGLQRLISEYKDKPIFTQGSNSEVTDSQNSFPAIIEQLVSSQLNQVDWTQVISKQLITAPSESENNPSRLQTLLLSTHKLAFDKIESELRDGPLHQWIIDELVSMIEKLDLRQMVKNKAKTFTPEKMESVFQNMISEQLVFIELLGALLGSLSGLALVDINLFSGLAGLLCSYYLADHIITSKRNNL